MAVRMVANGTGEYILVPKRILQALKAQLQRTTDALTLAETELQLVREECGAREGLAEKLTETEAELELVRAERDDLARRAQAAKAIWDPVTQPRSTSVDP